MIICDDSHALIEQVKAAADTRSPFNIVGGNSKSFIGVSQAKESLSVASHTGVISYEPTELVITARAGTPLHELNAELASEGQMLAFEPPVNPGSTIGGVLACGLSGPRRPYSGSARDFILGMRVVNGHGQDLQFGGEVMKNVAGYDVSRLQVGAFGTLGVLLDMSMKVLPIAECERTLYHQIDTAHDTGALIALARQPLPVSATLISGRDQYMRLSGSQSAVDVAANLLGGDTISNEESPWQAVRDHTHAFFADERPLWRLSVPEYAPPLPLDGDWLIEWGGALRWLKSSESAQHIFKETGKVQGHATCYSATDDAAAVFQPLQGMMCSLQRRVRDSFDPLRLFNPGRFHPELDMGPAGQPAPISA